MKRILAGLLIAAILILSLFFFTKHEKRADISPASFLPKDVLAFCHQKELDKHLSDFQKSRLGKALAGINILQTAKELNFPKKDIEFLEKVLSGGNFFIKSPLVKELFGKDVTIAWLPDNSEYTKNDYGKTIKNNIVVITKPLHGARLADLLASGFEMMVNQTKEEYRAFDIKKFTRKGSGQISAVAVQDFILLSFNERLLKNCIDRYIDKQSSLNDNPHFKKTRSMLSDPAFFTYLAVNSINAQFKKFLPITNQKRKTVVKDEFNNFKGIQAAGYGVWQEADRVKDRGVILLDEQKNNPAIRNSYPKESGKNSTLFLVPEQVFGYYWTSTTDLSVYWKMYLASEHVDSKKVKEIRKALQKRFGMTVEDILGMLDQQCGFMIQQGDVDKFLPLPEIAFFTHIKDKNNFDKFSDKLLSDSALNIKKLVYKGVKINSVTGKPHGVLMRMYVMTKDYFVACTSLSMMKKVVDVMQGGTGLKDTSEFKKVEDGLLGKNNSVAYIRVSGLLQTIKKLASWGRAILVFKDQKDAKKIGIVLDRLLNPLFDGLSMYSDFGLRSRIAPGLITVESTTLIKR